MQPSAILESALYVTDLDAAEAFYRDVLGLERIAKVEGRHVFFRCGQGVLLLFNAEATQQPAAAGRETAGAAARRLSAKGICASAATAEEIDAGRRRSKRRGIAIEADFEWPSAAARSISAIRPAIRSNSPNRGYGGCDAAAGRQEDRRGEPQCRQAAGNSPT